MIFSHFTRFSHLDNGQKIHVTSVFFYRAQNVPRGCLCGVRLPKGLRHAVNDVAIRGRRTLKRPDFGGVNRGAGYLISHVDVVIVVEPLLLHGATIIDGDGVKFEVELGR